MIAYNLRVHSAVDVITNSSSEIFVGSGDITVQVIKDALDKLGKQYKESEFYVVENDFEIDMSKEPTYDFGLDMELVKRRLDYDVFIEYNFNESWRLLESCVKIFPEEKSIIETAAESHFKAMLMDRFIPWEFQSNNRDFVKDLYAHNNITHIQDFCQNEKRYKFCSLLRDFYKIYMATERVTGHKGEVFYMPIEDNYIREELEGLIPGIVVYRY